MESTSIDKLLYAWLSDANESRERFRFPVGLLENSVALLQQMLGEAWLTANVLPKELDQPLLAPLKNPLHRYLRSGRVDRHVTEIVELAKYLFGFRSDSNLNGKIERLKGESFWPTFFELAMAHRMRLAGFRVLLSAEDGTGLGDFTIEHNGKKYICECARIEWTEGVTDEQAYLGQVYQYIEKKLKKAGFTCCIKLRIRGPLDRGNYATLLRLMRQSIEAFTKGGNEVNYSRDNCSVSVESLSETTETIPFRMENNQVIDERNSEWESAFEISSVPMTKQELLNRHARGEYFPKQERVRIFTAFERTGALISGEIDRIDNKLKKKINQTSIPEGYAGRIVLIESPTLEQEHIPRLTPRLQKRLEHSSRTACVTVSRRGANAYYRHHYSTLVQGNRPELYEPIRPAIQTFAGIDADFDVILGEKYPYSREEALRRTQIHQKEWEEKDRRRGANNTLL